MSQSDSSLVSGIAGQHGIHAEGKGCSLIGGWDSPRLQYARYRVLVGRDQSDLPQELMNDAIEIKPSNDPI